MRITVTIKMGKENNMAEKYLYYKRLFLNDPKKEQGAYIIAEVLRDKHNV